MSNIEDIDALAQEIRRVNGWNTFGAGALAELLMPFVEGMVKRKATELMQEVEPVMSPTVAQGMDNPGDTEDTLGPSAEWYCEYHPNRLMGHDECRGPGILACARIPMLVHHLRLARQETREANRMRDHFVALARQTAASRNST